MRVAEQPRKRDSRVAAARSSAEQSLLASASMISENGPRGIMEGSIGSSARFHGRSILLLALGVWLNGCDEASRPRVRVLSGPVVVANEGEALAIPVEVVPASAVPPTDLRIAIDDTARALFDNLQITVAGSNVALYALPRCDAVRGSGEGPAIAQLRIEPVPADAAEPAELTIEIEARADGGCLPRVISWYGDCAALPATSQDSIVVDPGHPGGQVCMRLESMDPSVETLWLRTSSDAPPTLIDPGALPAADGISGAATFTIPITNRVVRGSFQLQYFVYRAPPDTSVAAALSGAVSIVVGKPGDMAIEVLGSDFATDEFNALTVPFRAWYLPDHRSQGLQPCVRASRATALVAPPLDPTRRFLLLADAEGNSPRQENDWLCSASRDFAVRVSPPIDAAARELLRIEVGLAMPGGVPPVPSTCTPPACFEVPISIGSVADQHDCGTSVLDSASPQLACANLLAGDPTPEVIFRASNGSTCAFAGEQQRFRLVSSWAPGAAPEEIVSFLWQGPNGPEPVVLGESSVGTRAGRVQRLTMTSQAAAWIDATALGFADPACAEPDPAIPAFGLATPIPASRAAGAKYLAFPVQSGSEWRVVVRLLEAGSCSSTQLPVSVPLPRMLGTADLDGDGDPDLVYLGEDQDASGRSCLTATWFRLGWGTSGSLRLDGTSTRTCFVPSPPNGTVLGSAAIKPGCQTLPCPEDLYVSILSPAQPANLVRIGAGIFSGASAETVFTPGSVRGVATVDGKLMAALQFGVWRLDDLGDPASGTGPSWSLVDPVLEEQMAGTSLSDSNPWYGVGFANCLSAPPGLAFTAGPNAMRYTLDDVVVSPP